MAIPSMLGPADGLGMGDDPPDLWFRVLQLGLDPIDDLMHRLDRFRRARSGSDNARKGPRCCA